MRSDTVLLFALLLHSTGCDPGSDRKTGSWTAPVPGSGAMAWQSGTPPEFRGNATRLAPGDPPRETLTTSRAFGDTTAFGHITALGLVGGGIVLTDRLMDPHLAFIDMAGNVLNRFGSHGQGPGEFREPIWLTPHPGDSALVWLFDPQNSRFSLVRPGATRSSAIVAELPLNPGEPLQNPLWLGDRIISNGIFDDFSLLIMDPDGKPLARVSADPPYTERELTHDVGRRLLNRTFLAASPARDKIVLAYQFASRIDFFTAAGDRYGSAEGPRAATPSFRLRDDRFYWEPDNEMAYWGVAATDQYVYALFCGCALQDHGPPNLLHIFRWDGEFVGEIALDQPVLSFTVTPDDTAIFGAIEDPYPRLGQWLLPDWLQTESRAQENTITRGAEAQ